MEGKRRDVPHYVPITVFRPYFQGDKPHACELCHKRFALACNLRAHLKTHEGDPQEECVRCGKVYLASSQQIIHGFCTDCYQFSQGLPLVKTSSIHNGCKTLLPVADAELTDGYMDLSKNEEQSLCDSGEDEDPSDKTSEIGSTRRADLEEEDMEVTMEEEHVGNARTITSDEGCCSP